MERFQQEVTFTNAHLAHILGDDDSPKSDLPYTCWECGDHCEELVQARWTSEYLLVGECCQPVEAQAENEVTAEELVALAAEELAIFGRVDPETGCTSLEMQGIPARVMQSAVVLQYEKAVA